jgi:hypothetical protein
LVENSPHRVLNDFVLQRRDAQWLPAIGFLYVDSSRWLRLICPLVYPVVKIDRPLFQTLSILCPRHPVHPGRSFLLKPKITVPQQVYGYMVRQGGEL